jgi:type I restriction enzyme S subunit
LVPANTVIIASRVGLGKAAITLRPIAINQDLKALLPTGGKVLPRYLLHYFSAIGNQIELAGVGATVKGVTVEYLSQLQIPLPSLSDQKRIVDVLDEAQALKRLCANSISRTNDLKASIFDEMFSAKRAAAEGWPTKLLGDLTSNVSGGTPSTDNQDFWSGTIPWISPKDMKCAELFDAIDHVSDAAVKASRLRLLPKNTVVTVVRGMILAHTFPVAITRVEATINQDMKGFFVGNEILPDYLHWSLVANGRKLLSLVSTAGHGTKRLELDDLLSLPLVVPSKVAQKEFVSRIADTRELMDRQQRNAEMLNGLFNSLLNRAFRGEI